ncbi:amidohydrolase family protein [bacterium]|jgi:predicted TIM-barrel fold metal-dependent hydrolase|nr:amidohydrolase family protein [bacterium]
MFIDIHVHLRKHKTYLNKGKQVYATPEYLLERYDKLGIEKAVILRGGVSSECGLQGQSMEEVLEICDKYPDRFIPFCNIDPRFMTNRCDAPLDEMLQYYKDRGCKGIGELCANMPFMHPMVQNLFKCAEKVGGMPITFHIAPYIGYTYGLYDDPGLPQLEWTLVMHPDLYFLGHSTAFWAEIAELETPGDRFRYPTSPVKKEGVVPILFRRYKNLLGDLSAGSGFHAMARDPEYAVKFINEFQDRLFFGTDICEPDTETPLIDFLLKLRDDGKITETVFNKVARENAIKLLGLE